MSRVSRRRFFAQGAATALTAGVVGAPQSARAGRPAAGEEQFIKAHLAAVGRLQAESAARSQTGRKVSEAVLGRFLPELKKAVAKVDPNVSLPQIEQQVKAVQQIKNPAEAAKRGAALAQQYRPAVEAGLRGMGYGAEAVKAMITPGAFRDMPGHPLPVFGPAAPVPHPDPFWWIFGWPFLPPGGKAPPPPPQCRTLTHGPRFSIANHSPGTATADPATGRVTADEGGSVLLAPEEWAVLGTTFDLDPAETDVTVAAAVEFPRVAADVWAVIGYAHSWLTVEFHVSIGTDLVGTSRFEPLNIDTALLSGTAIDTSLPLRPLTVHARRERAAATCVTATVAVRANGTYFHWAGGGSHIQGVVRSFAVTACR